MTSLSSLLSLSLSLSPYHSTIDPLGVAELQFKGEFPLGVVADLMSLVRLEWGDARPTFGFLPVSSMIAVASFSAFSRFPWAAKTPGLFSEHQWSVKPLTAAGDHRFLLA